MKAIIFDCIDNFDEAYQKVAVCNDNEVKACVAYELSANTEIVDYKVVNACEYKGQKPFKM